MSEAKTGEPKLPNGIGGLLPSVYSDALSPSAKAVGHSLAGVVRAALRPVDGVVWTLDRAFDWVAERAAAYLEHHGVAADQIVSPPLSIEGPVLVALRLAGPNPDPLLRNMFAALLARSMNCQHATDTHPSFVETLKHLLPHEAGLLTALHAWVNTVVQGHAYAHWYVVQGPPGAVTDSHLAGRVPELSREHPSLWDRMQLDYRFVYQALDNLQRFGIIRLEDVRLAGENLPDLAGEPFVRYGLGVIRTWVRDIDAFRKDSPNVSVNPGYELRVMHRIHVDLVSMTDWGRRFAEACGAPDFFGSPNLVPPWAEWARTAG